MRLVGPDEVRAALVPDVVIAAVRAALVAHAEGATVVPAPTHLEFPDVGGDAHVKTGMLAGSATFAVKLATGFPGNRDLGLPANGGFVAVVSARTGEPLALLDDRGRLTAARTAAVAALATDALTPPGPIALGIVGTGEQATLAPEWLRRLRTVDRVRYAGRRPEAARALAAATAGGTAASVEEVLAVSDAVVTATAARAALFPAGAVRPGTHLTALGADMPGKQELPAGAFRGALVATDDLGQALDHGDLHHAVAAGTVRPADVLALGAILRDGVARPPTATTVADLTGVGALDAAVAAVVLDAVG